MGVARPRSLRDVVLILLGATCMHLASSIFASLSDDNHRSIVVNTQISSHHMPDTEHDLPMEHLRESNQEEQLLSNNKPSQNIAGISIVTYALPETTVASHAPGWTLFHNLYMSNGTLYVVSPHPPSSFPALHFMTSTGLAAVNTPENIAARLPTAENLDFITPEMARLRWGGDSAHGDINRVWSVQGNTLLFNDPSQFLDHYYHFCAELMFGAWAFWVGASNTQVDPMTSTVESAPSIQRAIFAHADAHGWRDLPGMNSYFLRAAFPSMTVEVQDDWEDRIRATSAGGVHARAWHFDSLLLVDRSAAFKGELCGTQVQRTAAEAFEHMRKAGNLSKWWWEPVRRAVLRFAGVDEWVLDVGVREDAAAQARVKAKLALGPAGAPMVGSRQVRDVVVTYISRQGTRRHLIDTDHDALVQALTEMCASKGWELNVAQAEKMTKEEQLALAARTTVSKTGTSTTRRSLN